LIEIAIIGGGRMGRTLAGALRAAGRPVIGPLGRGADGASAGVVLLCVPDAEIAAAAACVAPGRLVGHVSGATSLEPLAGHEAFSLHPLMTVTEADAERADAAPGGVPTSPFAGAGAAIAGSTPRALACARELATTLGMVPFEVPDADRAAYHAAASVASNYLIALQAAAERLLGGLAGREVLVRLVRQTVDNWAELGPERALTGPIARGDEETVARQRAAVAERAPDLLELFDALADATRGLARRAGPPASIRPPMPAAPDGAPTPAEVAA
jgi:predicted short-subunit dehydrogenase-like oxidoreductase (DUF2520 family)